MAVEQRDHVFNRSVKKPLPVIDRGEGVYLFDKSGRKYLDASSGALIAGLGHGNKAIAKAIAEQAERVAFVHGSQFTSEAAQQLAELLVEMTDGKLQKVYLVSGGSEATETAIKMARQYHLQRGNTSKYKVIAREPSYHGATLGALSLTFYSKLRRPYQPMLHRWPTIRGPYCYRCDRASSLPDCGVPCAWELESAIVREGPEYVSAFIAEPVSGTSLGCAYGAPEYYPVIRKICDKYDVLFIADEVMSGMCRTGKNFAIQHWGVVPDMILCGKAISGGYGPLGAVVVSQQVFDTFEKGLGRFTHGFSYQANPMMAAAGAAALQFMKENHLAENARVQGERLATHLRAGLAGSRIVGDIRGRGLMMAIELVKDKTTAEPFDSSAGAAALIVSRAFDKGLNLYSGSGLVDGERGDVVMIGPPLIITAEQIDELVGLLIPVVFEVEKALLGA